MTLLDRCWYEGRCVLVTGGAGFIGSHLAEALVDAGARVRILDSLADGTLDNLERYRAAVTFLKGDVLDQEMVAMALRNADIVFHLAANASVPRSVQDPDYDWRCNACGTQTLLSAMRFASISNCVVASSGAVYGQPSRFPIQENDCLFPISPYGASKAAVEALCHAFHASYGLPIQIARIFNTYGPRQPRFVMYDFYRKLRADPTHLEILGDGSQVRDYCFVEDTVDALLALGRIADTPCTSYNVSTGCSHSVTEVAEVLSAAMGLRDVRWSFTGRSWAGDAKRWEVSIDRLRETTGFEPQFDLPSGVARFVQWFDQHPERWA